MNVKKLFFSALLPLGFASLGMAQTQTVRMTTEKPVGSAITLVLNRTSGVTLDWGDGTPVEYAAGDNQVILIEGTTKGKELVLAVGGKLEMLTCSNAGLTALDVSGATMLRSLYCQNNSLTSLDLSGHEKLTDLDCSSNQLTNENTTEFSSKNFPAMETLNISGNKFNGYLKMSLPALQQLNVSHNEHHNMIVASDNLDVLNCSYNKLNSSNIYLGGTPNLSAFLCDHSAAGGFTIPTAGLTSLTIFRADNNKLKKLDLSQCPALKDLSCRNNVLADLTLPEDKKLNSMDCSHNNLLFRHLPVSSKKAKNMAYAPQGTVVVTGGMETHNGDHYIEFAPSWNERTEADYVLDLSAYRYDAGGVRTTVNFDWYSVDYSTATPTETELTEATAKDPEQDYYISAGKVSFLKGFNIVYAKMTSRVYPDLIIETDKFAVGKDFATDIAEVSDGDNGLRISIANGTLTMSSNAATTATVCSTDGKTVWQGSVNSNAVSVKLPQGVYIVNGKKVLL